MYALLATGVGLFVVIYSSRYIPLHLHHAHRSLTDQTRFFGFLLLFMASMVGLVMALAPLKQFGLMNAMVTTFQAVSGAGYPGVPSLDMIDNVVPFIRTEEEKMAEESRKILGGFEQGKGFVDADFVLSVTAALEAAAAVVGAVTHQRLVDPQHVNTVAQPLGAEPLRDLHRRRAGRVACGAVPRRGLVVRRDPDRLHDRQRQARKGRGLGRR